jgi:acyl dehydratase
MGGIAEVGDRRELVLVEDLKRTQIVQYAGASGDYNPLHTDDRYTTEVAGYPSVFAHGMLTMGMTGRILTEWFGAEAIRAFSGRFLAQVWPGDSLTAEAVLEDETTADGLPLGEVSITTRNQRDEVVMRGSATVQLNLPAANEPP